jgi:hypothetical protein
MKDFSLWLPGPSDEKSLLSSEGVLSDHLSVRLEIQRIQRSRMGTK